MSMFFHNPGSSDDFVPEYLYIEDYYYPVRPPQSDPKIEKQDVERGVTVIQITDYDILSY